MGQYDLSLGALLIGISLNTYLFGIVTTQFVTYYSSDFKDPWWARLSVAILLAVDIFHSCAVVYMAWSYFVTNFNNPAINGVALWPYTFTPMGTAIAAIITHMFLSYRIYRLNGRLWLLVVFTIGSLVSFSTAVAAGAKAWIIKDLDKLGSLITLSMWWLVVQMVLDVSIACVMAYELWISKTGFRATDNVIHRLIRGAIQTGAFSTIFAAGNLIFFVVMPDTQLYGMFAIPLGRVYTNTLMHTLNVRGGLREMLAETVDMSTSLFFGGTKSIQIRVQDSVTTHFDQVDEFKLTGGKEVNRHRGNFGMKTKGRQARSTVSDIVFADNKHSIA